MKRQIFNRTAALLAAVCLLVSGVYAHGPGTGTASYINAAELTGGFTHESAVSYNATGGRVETHVVSLAPDSAVKPIVLACDTIYGGLTVTEMIDYAEGLGYNVLGAVNSDFYFTSTKIPCGMVVEDGVYKSSAEYGCALAIAPGGAFVTDRPAVGITLTNAGAQANTANAGQSVTLHNLNKTRSSSGLYLYSEHFSTVSTRTSTEGWMVKFKILEGTLSVLGEMKLEVTGLYEGSEAQYIGEGNLILTADALAGLESEFAKFSVGDVVTLETRCSDARLAEADWVTGCGDLLVRDGQIRGGPDSWDAAIQGYNPRTAVGIRADGSLVFYTVDGRSSSSSGATMLQLAEDLIGMGCVTAANLDGGGSTVLALRDPKTGGHTVINSPSDGAPRRCGSYILFVSDDASGQPRLFLDQDGEIVLAGATLTLGAYAADPLLRPAALPDDTLIVPHSGSMSGYEYTAPGYACTEKVRLLSSLGSGGATLHVIEKADGLTISDAATGQTLRSLTLDAGESVNLAVSAKYLLRDVHIEGSEIVWSCTGGGTISEDGVFTASGDYGASGNITVSAAGTTAAIPVTLTSVFSDVRSHWAKPYIESLFEDGIVSGTGGGAFSPDAQMKRGDFLVMLHRACGRPAVTAPPSYADVPADSYYADAIAWAERSAIAFGSGDGLFAPEATLTREQAFTFVYRALGFLKINSPEPDTSLLARFTDGEEVAGYARDAAAALIELGVVSGSGDSIDPQGLLLRGQMARMLFACLELN